MNLPPEREEVIQERERRQEMGELAVEVAVEGQEPKESGFQVEAVKSQYAKYRYLSEVDMNLQQGR